MTTQQIKKTGDMMICSLLRIITIKSPVRYQKVKPTWKVPFWTNPKNAKPIRATVLFMMNSSIPMPGK